MAEREGWPMSIRDFISRLLDPIPQNPNAILYGWYDGMAIPLRPVMDSSGRITDWIKDPADIERLEAARARRAAAHPPPLVPAQPPALPPQTAQTAPSGFNPAGVAGL